MRFLRGFIKGLVVTNAWRKRVPMTCHDRWHLRQELDKLSRFSGVPSQADAFASNWLRRNAVHKTFHIASEECIQALRLVDNGRRLTVLGSKRLWDVDLGRDTVSAWGTLRKERTYALSNRGRVYSVSHDPVVGHPRVVECDGKPMFTTISSVYSVAESLDGTIAAFGLGSKHLVVVQAADDDDDNDDDRDRPADVRYVFINDVALASAACGTRVFSGLLNGAVHVYDVDDGSQSLHVLRTATDTRTLSTVRSLDVEMRGGLLYVYAGVQDGTVCCLRATTAKTDGDGLHELSHRQLHRAPVTQVRGHSGRLVSADADGRVLVTDMTGTKLMYDLTFPGRVVVDITSRILVIAHDNAIHVWDHGDGPRPLRDNIIRTPNVSRGGGGGGISMPK